MRVAECGRIFEAVAERAVEADVGDPNKSAGSREGHATEQTKERERERQHVGVRKIITERARPRSREIGEHRKVRRQKEQREGEPGEVAAPIDRESGGESGKPLEPQQQAHTAVTNPRSARVVEGAERVASAE